MNKPHKHAELIKAWAEGAEIEERYQTTETTFSPWYYFDGAWMEEDGWEYRIKPEPKPDAIRFLNQLRTRCSSGNLCWEESEYQVTNCAIKLTFDGETGELKSAEVLK